jgi:hypothetical protein
MDSDGSEQKQLIQTVNEVVFSMSWSPDGKHILVETLNPAEQPRLYIVDADGSNKRHLPVTTTPNMFMVTVLQWCWLDNTHVIFGGRGLSGAETYLVDINTSESRLILHNSHTADQYFSCQP